MKRNFKFGLSSFALLVACSAFVGTQVSALDIQLHGRVDFLATLGKQVTEQRNQTYTGPAHATLTGTQTAAQVAAVGDNALVSGQGDEGFIAYLDDFESDDTFNFDTDGRIDVAASGETAAFDYGAFVRLNVDPDANSVIDTDAFVYVKGSFGDLKFGTDVDTDDGVQDHRFLSDGPKDAFEVDFMSAGPMSAGNQVTLPIADHAFTLSPQDESSITYISPSFNGLKLAGEIDDDGDWMLGAGFETVVEGYKLGADAAYDGADAFAARAKIGFGDLSAGAQVGFDDDDESYIGGALGYGFGAVSMSLETIFAKAEFFDTTNDNSFVKADEVDVVGGIAYKVAPGMSVAGSVGYYDREVEGNDNGSAAVSWAGSGHQLSGVQAQGRIRLEF